MPILLFNKKLFKAAICGFFAFALILDTQALANNSKVELDHFSLSIANKVSSDVDSTRIDFGINIPKKGVIKYIPYIGIFFQQSRLPLLLVDEKAKSSNEKINSAIVGIRLGSIFPVTTYDFPYFIIAAVGAGNTTVQERPWWGTRDDSLSKQALLQLEVGLRFLYDQYFYGYSYSVSNINYLDVNHELMLGVMF